MKKGFDFESKKVRKRFDFNLFKYEMLEKSLISPRGKG